MKKRLCFLLVAILIFMNINVAFATETSLSLESEAVILMEETTGKVIYEKNSNQKMYPASTTKILTALIALENANINDIVEIGNEVNFVPLDASKAGHRPGDKLTLEELLHALLLPSGNDSAYAVANYIAKKTTGNETLNVDSADKEFSELMNARVKEIGANNSNFVNPHGYHNDNHYTTAYDMALITREAIKNPKLKEILNKYEYSMIDSRTGQTINWRNRNLLLNSQNQKTYYPYANGGKTGFTNEAGECLVSTASKDGLSLISVVLKSPKEVRFDETKELFEYGFNNYILNKFISAGSVVEVINVDKHSPKGPSGLEVIAVADFVDLIKIEDISNVERVIEWNEILVKAPVQAGEQLGKVIFKLNDNILSEISIVAKTNIEKETIIEFLFSFKAIPYWAGGIGAVTLIFTVIRFIKKRNSRRGFRIRR